MYNLKWCCVAQRLGEENWFRKQLWDAREKVNNLETKHANYLQRCWKSSIHAELHLINNSAFHIILFFYVLFTFIFFSFSHPLQGSKWEDLLRLQSNFSKILSGCPIFIINQGSLAGAGLGVRSAPLLFVLFIVKYISWHGAGAERIIRMI